MRIRNLRQAEVEDFRVSLVSNEDVRRLDIAMNDAFGVRRIERVSDFYSNVQQLLEIHRTSLDQMFQRLPAQTLHHQEQLAIEFADFVDRANTRMIQCRRRSRFSSKTFEGLRVFGHVVRKEFQSDETAERRVFGFVDHAHPTAAEPLQDSIVRYCLADHAEGLRLA